MNEQGCVKCGRLFSQHHPETKVCPDGRSEFATMALPAGRTCGDCVHFKRCEWLISCKPERTSCDWYPVRFHAISPVPTEAR